MKKDPYVSSVPDRIKGGISALLCIASLTVSCNATDTQVQAMFLFSGMLYMLTTFAFFPDKVG